MIATTPLNIHGGVKSNPEATLEAQLNNLPPEFLLDVKEGAPKFSDGEGNIKIASLFGGFEVVQWSYKAIENTAFRVLGLDIKFVVQYVSESDLPTLGFLMHNSEAKYIFEHVKDLVAPCVKDRRTGHKVVSPPSDWLVFGFFCKAISQASNVASANKACVRKKEASTGESFEDALVVIDVTQPKGILCENVKQMTTIVDAESDDVIDSTDALMKGVESDAKYVLKCFSDNGFFAKDFIMEARDHGSKAKRVRWLALGWREDVAGALATFVDEYMPEFLARMRIAQGSIRTA